MHSSAPSVQPVAASLNAMISALSRSRRPWSASVTWRVTSSIPAPTCWPAPPPARWPPGVSPEGFGAVVVRGVGDAELVLEDLAAHGLREGVGEHHGLGGLVAGQRGPAVRDQLRLGGRVAGGADHDRGDRLA